IKAWWTGFQRDHPLVYRARTDPALGLEYQSGVGPSRIRARQETLVGASQKNRRRGGDLSECGALPGGRRQAPGGSGSARRSKGIPERGLDQGFSYTLCACFTRANRAISGVQRDSRGQRERRARGVCAECPRETRRLKRLSPPHANRAIFDELGPAFSFSSRQARQAFGF